VDAAALKQNWRSVAQYGDQVPLFFYSMLFLANPGVREMFPVSMAGQRDKLVTALGQVVSGVDDVEALVPFLQQLGRDHRKFAVVREHYPAVGQALLATLEHFSGAAWNEQLAQDWAAAYTVVAQVMADAADVAAAESPPWWEAEVVHHERRTLDVAVLTLVPNYRFPYLAGQSMALETPQRPRMWRYYSPATLPRADGSFDIHVRIVPGGTVSMALVHGTGRGDVLRLGSPVGRALTLGSCGHRDLLMLAGGTGVAPMKALVEQVEAEGGGRSVTLFWGAPQHRDLYDLVALREKAEKNDWLRLVPCTSEEHVGGGVETGTVVEVARRHGPWPDHDVLVCGSPRMVRATAAGMAEGGTPPGLVHVEEFGNEEATP
jgi:NAD(P)H-flavin reductase/hemoglobin-like flavoprotein